MLMTNVVPARHAVPVDEPAEPEVPERATRRVFSAQYKLRILAEYERRDRSGRSALLRREGLYTSSISEWWLARGQSTALDCSPSASCSPMGAAPRAWYGPHRPRSERRSGHGEAPPAPVRPARSDGGERKLPFLPDIADELAGVE